MFGKGKKRKIWRKILDIFSGSKKRGKKDAPKVRDNKETGRFSYEFFGFGGDCYERRDDSGWDDPWRKV